MDWHLIAAVLVTMAASYLLGCCNTSIVISKYVLRDDVRNHGSGNAGLTNFYRVFGKQKILLVILADVLKTVIAVLAGAALFRWAGNDPIIGKLLGGLLCMVGHMFPFQFEFKGGKGVACSAAVGFFVDPLWGSAAIVACLAVIALTRFISLGSMTMLFCYMVLMCIAHWGQWAVCLFTVVLFAMCVWRHRSNIQRLLSGTENRIGQKAK